MSYLDLTVNLEQPENITDWTATVMLAELRADRTGEVFTAQIKDACESHPEASSEYISAAVKALRNLGFAITTHKARHLSWYTLATEPGQIEEHHQRIAREQYSERVSWVRSMHEAAHDPTSPPSLLALYSEGQMQAMGLGRLVGLTPSEVVEDCTPLTV
jgi:hypothetical protein